MKGSIGTTFEVESTAKLILSFNPFSRLVNDHPLQI